MSYVNSQAFVGRGSQLQYSTNPPCVAFNLVGELKTAAFSGSKYDLEDVTNFESSNFKEWLPTLADSGEISFTGNLLPNDTSETDLIGFFNNATLVSWEIVLPPGPAFSTSEGTFAFRAFVTEIARDVQVSKAATITGKLKITGKISFTAGS